MNASPEVRRGVLRYVMREYFGVLFLALLFRYSSGTWEWRASWAVVALYFCWVTATCVLLIPRVPELLAERAKRSHPNAKRWDVVLLGLFGMETMARYTLAGLDVRYGWTQGFPVVLQFVGTAMGVFGFSMVLWSMGANTWFSTVVRMQEERGQQVATGGPYAYVRHPGYVGTCLFEVGTGLMLGSWPAVVSGFVGAAMMVLRTAWEDATLHEELQGYADYAKRVRWRLLPGVW